MADQHEPAESPYQRDIAALRRRLARQSTLAVGMLEAALDALWSVDPEVAELVRQQDDAIDAEEVAMEQEIHRIMTLLHPVAREFRIISMMLSVNHDIERVADHACSIAKSAIRLSGLPVVPRFPTSLRELGERVPATCHRLMRALLDEDSDESLAIVKDDKVLDRLDRAVFDELTAMIAGQTEHEAAAGLLLYRAGRDLERVGDLMKAIAESVVYIDRGTIVRHSGIAKRRSG
ncbi:MAG: PhoU domain-containing protein [Planctomycetota bacterium]